MKGRLQIETVASLALAGNPLGDPRRRDIPVYLPPSYGRSRGRRYPVIFFLPGFGSDGRRAVNHEPWKENVAERLDRLIGSGKARESALVFVDAFSAYGGSQYMNSAAVGRYEDFVVDELVPWAQDKFAFAAGPGGRALMGKSSGGYGALMLGMRHPGVFAHVACHSGDMLFEVCYAPDFRRLVSALGPYGGSARRFVKAFRDSPAKARFDHDAVNVMAMAACYSPNPRSPLGFDLPCDERTAEVLPRVWARWKAQDPVEASRRHSSGLRKLKTLFFDCGRRDEFFLHLGARKLSSVLKGLGVRHVYEEHELGHFDMNERYDRSLALLTSRLR